ncbi:hypothetical protein WSS_A32460 [Rhodococcus opacus M213]|uniref:Uncharacterized protein n=2 Tax=Rhodococcus opacus TaxID=37919 RepID=K8XJG7_RHOOP|nr:hypothetical protein R1CP_37290 [Rhodococcus opacus]EKT78437.1 hypothetical protein WSS_A32460 [Rhodococcus opacus M213]
MSARRRKAAFDPGALGDLDDLLPTLSIVTETVDETTAPKSAPSSDDQESETAATVPEPSPVALPDPPEADASPELPNAEPEAPQLQSEVSTPVVAPRRKTKPRSDSSPAPIRTAPPEVYLPPAVYTALRQLTLEERQRDRATARPYGQVVLDAVERHAGELQRHWSAAEPQASAGLFKRREAGAQPRRRRHSEIQARVPLAGIIASDTATLDALAEEWSAGSRSALVEHALRLYLDVRPD